MYLGRLPLLVLCCALAAPAQAGDANARAWLERMTRALSTGNYEGRFFHLSDSRSEAMRIIHRVERGRVTERLVSLDGSGREIIRNDREVVFYMPDQRTVLVERRTEGGSLLGTVPSYSASLEGYYSIETGEAGKTLGRRTQVILVKPRDQYRYGYRLWLDQETAMPLKSQLKDHDGNVIEQILFAEINFRERIPASDLKPAVDTEGFRWVRQDAQVPDTPGGAAGWSAMRLPAGFRLTTWRVQIMAGSSAPVRHLVFSDGLASVSVFIEPRDSESKPMRGLARLGAAFAYSRDLDGHQVTAVGEVPAATVEVIASGVIRAATDADAEASATDPAAARSPGKEPPP